MCLLNARSIKNKSSDFVCYGLSAGADVFAITETWFTDIHKDMAHKAEITLPGYKLLDHPRTERSGGGTALLCMDNITVHKVRTAGNAGHLSFPNGYYNIAVL
jgi:hypothetical protein